MLTTAIQYIYEKKLVLDRILMTGTKKWEIMVAFSLPILAILFVQTVLAFGIASFQFDIKIQGSPTVCIGLGVLVGLSGVTMVKKLMFIS